MNRSLGLGAGAIAIVLLAGYLLFAGPREQAPSPDPAPAADAAPVAGSVPAGQRHDAVRYDAQGVAVGGVEPNPSGGVPLDIDNIIASADRVVVISADEADTFTVPVPGDPRWPDYLEYRRTFRSALDATPGFVTAYDPEWRSQITGRREAPDPQYELFGGDDDLRGLLQQVLERLHDEDEQGLVDLALRKEEFEIICWPSFPQSRPYLRYKWEESWGFQYASILGGIKEGIRDAGGRPLDVASVAYDEIQDFVHFRIYENVRIGAVDRESGETMDLDFVQSVIERNGILKVYQYHD